MKWLKWSFIFLLLILCLPVWRLLDWTAITLAHPLASTSLMIIWGWFFLFLPLLMIVRRLRWLHSMIALIMIAGLSWWSGPLSSSSSLHFEMNHCGRSTYTGFFYPFRSILSPAHQDDLEVRNQLCWVRKMIRKVPERLDKDELELRLNHLKNILLKPNFKYRITLPAILILVGNYISVGYNETHTLERAMSSKLFLDSLAFWSQQYSEEISGRTYGWHEWPHSNLIQAEYGFIERNWNNIYLKFDP
jgi:hypothetical protein